MVQGQENRPMSCRSRKIGIRQKSGGHCSIYVVLRRRLNISYYVGAQFYVSWFDPDKTNKEVKNAPFFP